MEITDPAPSTVISNQNNMERKMSLEEGTCRPRPEILARRSMSICSANILSHTLPRSPEPKNNINKLIPRVQSDDQISKDLSEVQKKKFGTRSKTIMDCRSYMEKRQAHCPMAKRSSSVRERRTSQAPSSGHSTPSKSSSQQSIGSKTWDTTEKVLGVHTVLGTAGLTSSTLITIPSLGGGVVGGCAAAAIGVATAASFVTGVGVLAGLGVAGVQYAKARHKESKEEEEDKKAEKSRTSSESSFSDIESEESESSDPT